jgi:arylsulfatase A-like enzyme
LNWIVKKNFRGIGHHNCLVRTKKVVKFGLISALCFAVNSFSDNAEGWAYTLDDGLVTITGCAGTCSADLVIPETINGNRVGSIGQQAFYQNQLTSVSLPDGLVSIKQDAFHGNQLTSFIIPDSVTSIEQGAFARNQLTSIVMPENLMTIGLGAFFGNQLSVVVIPDSVTSVGQSAFRSNRLTSVTISNGLTEIKDKVFYDNLLANVTIPDSVVSIGKFSFKDNQLTKVSIPPAVASIGPKAFSNNPLTRVLFNGDRPSSFSLNVFDSDPDLSLVTYCTGRAGWPGKPISNGVNKIKPVNDCDGDGYLDAIDASPSSADKISDDSGSSLSVDSSTSLGRRFSCVLNITGIVCWGDNSAGQTDVPMLTNPTQLAAGYEHACALDETGVVCWGNNDYGEATVPEGLSNPTAVASGRDHSCAIDDTGVVCWGRNQLKQLMVPKHLKNPRQISTRYDHTCVVDNSVRGVACWGARGQGRSIVPDDLSNPTQVSAGLVHSCAVDDSGIVCWGSNRHGRSEVPQGLVRPSRVSAGAQFSCAVDDNGVSCWGRNQAGQTVVPPLSNPVHVYAANDHVCAIDDNGPVCWGGKSAGKSTVPGSPNGAVNNNGSQKDSRPNIVLVLLDDAAWDTLGESALSEYPTLDKIAREGLYIDKFFLTTPVCGPSRASILRGQLAHNTGIHGNSPPNGGFGEFYRNGFADRDMGALMNEADYATYFVGKYQNNGFPQETGDREYVPPGWDKFYGTLGNYYYGTAYTDNGRRGVIEPEKFRSDHEFDVAVEYVKSHKDGPFLLYFAPFNPHSSPGDIFPNRHADIVKQAPRTENFNEEDVSDKVGGIDSLPLLDEELVDEIHTKRVRSVAAIDDQIQRLLDVVPDNTYIFITSDNGFHTGEHRTLNKLLPYERIISAPMIVSGPNVELGRLDAPMFSNIDLLPTFLDIAGGVPPDFVDGRSFLTQINDLKEAPLRESILIESWINFNVRGVMIPMEYSAVRTLNEMYIEWAHGPTEYYDLATDPWQLESTDENLSELLNAWKNCSGKSC